jgi:ribosomal protein S18 acetylase RimI-like enzyme
MAKIRPMEERDAERVRDLWLQMCAEAGTPLPATSSQRILANLRQYATHQFVHCFVAEEQQTIIGFVTCCVSGHPVMPGLSGEIEELYVEARRQEVQADLVRQAVAFLQAGGAGSIHTRICVGRECPEEEELRSFWQSLGWENDMTIYSIYSNVPGDPALQYIWDEYQAHS